MTARGTFGEYVTIDSVRLAAFIRDGNGPVIRDLMRRGDRVKSRAQELVGVSNRRAGGGARGAGGRFVSTRKPGTLRDSIVKRLTEQGGMPAVLVGTDDPIGLWHHEGTHPHLISPRSAGGRLSFYWDAVGRRVSLPVVHHPGTQPNRFLVNALPAANG